MAISFSHKILRIDFNTCLFLAIGILKDNICYNFQMSIFLFFYFLINGLFHFFFYTKLRIFFQFSSFGKLIYIFISIFLILSPIIGRFFEKAEFIKISTIIFFLFFFWIAYLFIFTFFGILTFPLNFIQSIKIGLNKIIFFLPIFIIILGIFQEKYIKIKRYEIRNEKIKKEIKIGFFSDLHLGITQREKKVKEVIELFEKENIDILLCGGDTLDSSYIKNLNGLEYIKNFNPRLGKYSVLGNHEWYVGAEKSKNIFKDLGFKVLKFESVEIEGNILIAGAEDETAKYFSIDYDEKNFLKNLSDEKFIIYIRHRPPKEKLDKINLCLSGHTHNGQFFPFSIITNLFFKYNSGFYTLSNNFYIYVSSGAGSWGPPIRFLTSRDISIFHLKSL